MPDWDASKWLTLCLVVILIAGGWALWAGR